MICPKCRKEDGWFHGPDLDTYACDECGTVTSVTENIIQQYTDQVLIKEYLNSDRDEVDNSIEKFLTWLNAHNYKIVIK